MRFPVTFHQTGGANHIYLSTYKEWLAKQQVTSVYSGQIGNGLRFQIDR
jgi:hypothetical protein